MELQEIIRERRSYRKYNDKKVSGEDLKEIVEAGLWAPSATNIQPWYFVAIANEEVMEELRAIAGKGSIAFKEKLMQRFPDHPEVVRDTTSFIGTLGGAPCAVLAFARAESLNGDSPAIQSIGAAIENMILTAYGKGIKSCWLTSLSRGETADKIHERFAPERGELEAVVVFGYSDQEAKAPKRKDDRAEFILQDNALNLKL